MTNVDRRSKELERRAEELQRTQAEIDLAKDDLALGVMRSAALEPAGVSGKRLTSFLYLAMACLYLLSAACFSAFTSSA